MDGGSFDADRYPELETPVVLVDLDVLAANLDAMAARAKRAGVRLRPHAKTHKSNWIASQQLERGATGLTVAKLGEAEVFADGGASDILIAYPIVGAAKLERLRALAERIHLVTNLDSIEVARGYAEVGRDLPEPLPVMVEVDSGLGRCGRAPGEPSADVAETVASLPGLRLLGLLTFAGHVYRARDARERETVALAEARALVLTAEALDRRGIEVTELSIGSTPTVAHLDTVISAFPAITEVRPGTYVFNDANQVALGTADETDCALRVLVTVISRPAADRIVVDAGTKTLGSDAGLAGGFGRVRAHSDHFVEALSEEHAVIRVPATADQQVGDRLEIIPNHACVVPNLADSLVGVRGGRVERTIEVEARGRNR